MSFLQFASNNVKRNARTYLGYLLSSAFAVMIFFIYAMFIFHPDLSSNEMGRMTTLGMRAAEYVIFVVSFLFVFYSISAFLKARKKEFGILSILGAEDRQINGLIFLENMLVGSASILLGIGSGMIFAKLFLILGAKVVEMNELPFYLPWKAIGLTVGCFFALFLVISLFSVVLVRKNKVLELLQGASKPKTEPKASVLLSLLSVGSLYGVYYYLNQSLTQNKMILILVLGIIGTYLLFTQLSVLVIRLLKKNRTFFWRGTNLLWVSEMAYKMKDNARMFFLITIVTTMACSAVGMVLSFMDQNKAMYQDQPFAMSFSPNTGSDPTADIAHIDETLAKAGIAFQKVSTRSLSAKLPDQEIQQYVQVMDVSNYNKVAKVLQLDTLESVSPQQAVVLSTKNQPVPSSLREGKSISLTSGGASTSLDINKQMEQKQLPLSPLFVVSDEMYQQMLAKVTTPHSPESEDISYFVPEWSKGSVPSSDSQEFIVGNELGQWNEKQLDQEGMASGYLQVRAYMYMHVKQATRVMSFIGVFIAAIFSLSTASFLYFKLYNDLNQDQTSYRSLSKIGLSTKEMQRSSSIQIAALFFIPLVVAALQTLVGLGAILKQTSMSSTLSPSLMAIGAFFVVQLIYFLLVRSRYLAQLRRVMV